MKNKTYLVLSLVLLVLLTMSACSSAEGNLPGELPVEEGEGIPPLAAVKARQALALELNVEVEKVEILSQEQAEWMDSCLGLGGPAESCLQAIFPGWRVVLSSEGQTYVARTDELGDIIRFE